MTFIRFIKKSFAMHIYTEKFVPYVNKTVP